ncbi:MAG: alpha/beta fold hydrolase [Actinobacteria bacterium]|jgi:pimeloyl-ACP methyl ester carboxylesterase|nr:alpha/beta fold hydrolase [Actinomycetota bacterium]MBT4036891.1 alpha/beta fold hydrolase [Actinomycetota bacterium]MBT4278479.1 alpha/beta fold hydrolase [Actinomycetota bacterium]MBT4343710.1 alpha/beta fold hydrolase [Actinomycetota bacterium]MBT6065052.1 alpha/beta fold hydrolase [Actinomycetota bacterium]
MIAGHDGVQIATTSRGNGPSLVFTHGWANDRSVWTPIADDLADDHAVTTWDLRGHGESDTPQPGNYSRQNALGDMNAVVDGTNRPAVLIGHSLGGYLSLAYALAHPDDVSALVLVASGPGFRKVEARDEWNEAVVASTKKLGLPPGVEELSMHVDSMVIDRLTEITAPVLILLGERDRRFAAAAGLFQRDLDVRDTVIVPDQGHMVHVKAARQCADAIRSFVAGT